jgi:3-hydroxyacyl-[acyl-carrier-protein] dehydratase
MRFLLVDRILRLDPGVSIEAEKTMPASEEMFRDHFPGFPVVPGVLLTEMMGQTAAKCLKAAWPDRGNPMLAEIRSARFRSWVRPEETIQLFATIERSDEKFAITKCYAQVGDKRVCSAELMLVFAPAGDFSPDFRDEVLDNFYAQKAGAEPRGRPR